MKHSTYGADIEIDQQKQIPKHTQRKNRQTHRGETYRSMNKSPNRDIDKTEDIKRHIYKKIDTQVRQKRNTKRGQKLEFQKVEMKLMTFEPLTTLTTTPMQNVEIIEDLIVEEQIITRWRESSGRGISDQ